MEGKSVLKVEGGKLLKIHLKYEDGVIKEAKIMGDFFLHPEEGLDHIETALLDVPLEGDGLLEAVNFAIEENDIKLIGITSEAIVKAVLEAAK